MQLFAIDSTPAQGKVYCLNSAIEAVQVSQDFEPEQKCPSCGGTHINIVKMPESCAHYAARRCGNCDRFLSWEPRPTTVATRQRRQTTISQMLQSPHLSQWERDFLMSVQGKRSLSPKQQQVLSHLEAKLEVEG